MAQGWYGLNTYNVTELKNHSKYYMQSSTNIVFWNNMSKNFICYMPDTGSTISATTAIKFHDCYRVGDTGYAHASFAFNAPGYVAVFPLMFGFAGCNEKGERWVIGSKQVLTQETSSGRTYWEATFETSFGWPTASAGVVPFIGVGGHPVYQRYNTSDKSGSITYYTWYNNDTKATYSGTVPSINYANTGAADFAANCFDQSVTGLHANVLCPYVFPNWSENARGSFMGGWNGRNGIPEGQDGYHGHYLGVGFVFCGKTSYTAMPTLSDAPYLINRNVWVFNSSRQRKTAKKITVYNSSKQAKAAHTVTVYGSDGKGRTFHV